MVTKLPSVANVLYASVDAADLLNRLNAEMQDLSGEVFYADQISLKLKEASTLITSSNNENAFLRRMRDKWSKEIWEIFVKENILFDSTLRRKNVFSILAKMNRIMADGKSINSMHDLMGIEFEIYTPGESDTKKSVMQMYQATNIILDYFSDSKRCGEKFMICDSSAMKDIYPLETMLDPEKRPEIVKAFTEMNPHCYIPRESGLLPQYRGFVKDYYRQPKIQSCYQGLQFVLKTEKGFYFEIQVKTQPAYEYKSDPDSLAFHGNYRTKQNQENKKRISRIDVTQFDLTFDPAKVKQIYGFRANPDYDKSGIIAPIRWDLRKNTYNN